MTSKYFEAAERIALLESFGLHAGDVESPSAGLVLKEATEAAKRKGRCARFAVRVVTEYRFTCALTGYCCLTGEGVENRQKRNGKMKIAFRWRISSFV